MDSGDRIPCWSVFDKIKIIPSKPEALMAEINSGISSLEYAKATKLLNSPIPLLKDKKRNDDANPNSPSVYDVRRADEAYKAGLASLAAGDLEEASRSLNLALSKCPPHKVSAIDKLRSLISLTAQRLQKSPGLDD
ncbi:hypothetical protein L2E82_27087 [Cichorium intybus]|uniref:Uncharacterized protein n=1 Tax=Cichorium intybus TaxID=13427 RepID=A0ACB9CS01_CICIN|nr:hypothetical protein L2E82_27087 [Cichorium intybus]